MGCDNDVDFSCFNLGDYKPPAYKAFENMKSIINDFNNKKINVMEQKYLISTESIKEFIKIIENCKALEKFDDDIKNKLINSFKNYNFEKNIKIYKYDDCENVAKDKEGKNEFIIVDNIFIENMKVKKDNYQTVDIDISKMEIKFDPNKVINFEEIKSGFFRFKIKENNINQNEIITYKNRNSSNNNNNNAFEKKDNNNEISNIIKGNENNITGLFLNQEKNFEDNGKNIIMIKKQSNSDKNNNKETIVNENSPHKNNDINYKDINLNEGALEEVKNQNNDDNNNIINSSHSGRDFEEMSEKNLNNNNNQIYIENNHINKNNNSNDNYGQFGETNKDLNNNIKNIDNDINLNTILFYKNDTQGQFEEESENI